MGQEEGTTEMKEATPRDIFSELPKISFIFNKKGGFEDYETPEPNSERGRKSSGLGHVKWESEPHRRAFQAYDAIMRCPTVYAMTHIGGYAKARASFHDVIASHGPRYVVGGGRKEECEALVESIIDWTNNHPELFRSYLDQVELRRDKNAFIINSIEVKE